jgi:hypothetical protein
MKMQKWGEMLVGFLLAPIPKMAENVVLSEKKGRPKPPGPVFE